MAISLEVETSAGRAAAIAFGTSVVTMFGASALYHTVDWPEARRRWMRRLDHAGGDADGERAGHVAGGGLVDVLGQAAQDRRTLSSLVVQRQAELAGV